MIFRESKYLQITIYVTIYIANVNDGDYMERD